MDLGERVAEAVDFLRTNEPPEGYFLGFSGGKDSIVCEHLAFLAGVKYVPFFTQTGIDPPEVLRFIHKEYPHVRWLHPAKSFYALLQTQGPPLRTRRWCCTYLKERPSWGIPLQARIFGIRAEESAVRKERGRVNPRTISKRPLRVLTGYHPIFTWSEELVWQFIDAYRLSVPSLYDDWPRIGCVVCPNNVLGREDAATRRRQRSQERWPGIWKAFEHAVKKWWSRRTASGARRPEYPDETADSYWNDYLRHFTHRV